MNNETTFELSTHLKAISSQMDWYLRRHREMSEEYDKLKGVYSTQMQQIANLQRTIDDLLNNEHLSNAQNTIKFLEEENQKLHESLKKFSNTIGAMQEETDRKKRANSNLTVLNQNLREANAQLMKERNSLQRQLDLSNNLKVNVVEDESMPENEVRLKDGQGVTLGVMTNVNDNPYKELYSTYNSKIKMIEFRERETNKVVARFSAYVELEGR
jgi:chromosome segregation ATPase